MCVCAVQREAHSGHSLTNNTQQNLGINHTVSLTKYFPSNSLYSKKATYTMTSRSGNALFPKLGCSSVFQSLPSNRPGVITDQPRRSDRLLKSNNGEIINELTQSRLRGIRSGSDRFLDTDPAIFRSLCLLYTSDAADES